MDAKGSSPFLEKPVSSDENNADDRTGQDHGAGNFTAAENTPCYAGEERRLGSLEAGAYAIGAVE